MLGCPPDEHLLALLADTHPDAASDFDTHLADCPACQSRLDSLSDAPRLAAWISDAPPRAAGLPFLDPPTRPGDLGCVGRFLVEAELGRGGMGVVFRAWDADLRRHVALKVVRAGADDEQAAARFVRESRAVANLRHDHILPVLGVENTPDGRLVIVMPVVVGPSLRDRLRAGPGLAPRAAAALVREVADGLAAAHAAGVVHRDVKPANVLIDDADGRAKLTDFGLARSTAAGETLTQDGMLVGTPEYISPEQATDPSRADPRSDVYSLGVTLYECLTGVVPFRGSPLEVVNRHVSADPVPPRNLNAGVPNDLNTICLKCLEKNPARRYESAAAARDDLDRWLTGRPVLARPLGAAGRAWRWCRRNPLPVAVVVVSVLGTVASATGWWRAGVKATEAAQNADAAGRARDLAVEKTKLSEERALIALGTINTLIDKSQKLAGNAPGTLALRKQLAEAALADLRKLAAGNDRVPDADRFTLAAHVKLAQTFETLGQTDDALPQWEKAITLGEALVRDNPADVRHVRDLTHALVRAAYIHRRRANPAKEDELLRRAIDLLEEAARLAPDDRIVARELSVVFNARGDSDWEAGRARPAVPFHLRALAQAEALVAADAGNVLYRDDLRYTHRRLASCYGMLADFAAADKHQREAEEAAARALALDPASAPTRRNWHVAILDRANTQTKTGNFAGAEQSSREAIRLLLAVAAADPDDAQAQRDLAVGHGMLGESLAGLEQFDDAVKALEESLCLREKLAGRSKGSALVSSDALYVINRLIMIVERTGRYDEAGRWCDRYVEGFRNQPDTATNPNAAAIFARFAAVKVAYAAAPQAMAEAGFLRTQKPAVAVRLIWLRATALARSGRLDEALATVDDGRALFPDDEEVMLQHACISSYCAGRTSDAPARAKRLDAALATLTAMTKKNPNWVYGMAFYPELLPARAHPGFARCLEAGGLGPAPPAPLKR